MSEMFDCMKGWLVAPSPTSDEYVPFFINVRGSDIVWDSTDLPDELAQFKAKLGTMDNCEVLYPLTAFKGTVGDWIVIVYNDGKYEASNKLNIQSLFKKSGKKLTASINLPFNTLKAGLTFQTSIWSNKDIFTTSLVTGYVANTDNVAAMNISLYNVVSEYSSSFASDSNYADSYVNVTIHGKINLS